MNRKASLSFWVILGFILFASKTLIAAGKPDVIRHEATFMESTVNVHIEWQSPNPVVMVRVTIANKQQEIKVDPYDNKRNRDGYAGEVNVTVGLDGVPSQPFNYIIQLEDELKIKSALVRGKVRVASIQSAPTLTQPQQPSMQIQIQQNTPQPGTQTSPGSDQGGALVIIITPQTVVDTGAAWRVGGLQWMKSGETFPNIAPGVYLVEFKEMDKWTKPEDQIIMIEVGKVVTINGAYKSK